jgi:hypothetical protein
METMQQIVQQEMNEERFNRKHIDRKIREAIMADIGIKAQLIFGVTLLEKYMAGSYYESKMRRLAQLKGLDMMALATDVFVGIAYCQRPELLSSVAAQMAHRLKFSDKVEAITTIAEIIAVLCMTDAFDIMKQNKMASLMVQSRMRLPQSILQAIEESEFLPPMVCEPLELVNNYSSGYLTHNDSLILGGAINHHDGDLCLDVLNIMNRVPLQLDLQFLCSVEEQPTFDLDAPEKIDNWQVFKKQSYRFYTLIQQCGNRFWLTHKVDKRGRIYAQGYHINTQGASFKKAMVELAKEELVEGVPT